VTLFDHPEEVDQVLGEPAEPAEDGHAPETAAVKRPSRWSVRNWPVRWKVLAIALLPLALAGLFGGLRVSNALTEANQLRLVADRAEMIPAITNYMSALGDALVAASSDGDAEGARKNFENRKYELQSRLSHTDVATDVRSGVETLISSKSIPAFCSTDSTPESTVLKNHAAMCGVITPMQPVRPLASQSAFEGESSPRDQPVQEHTGDAPTGVFFFEPSTESLIHAMESFERRQREFEPCSIRDHVAPFDRRLFKERMNAFAMAALHGPAS